MKNKSTETRVQKSKTDAVTAGEGKPIRPKCSKPKEGNSNRRRPLYQLIENHMADAPIPDSVQLPKLEKELKK
jgi:hypothetical protein